MITGGCDVGSLTSKAVLMKGRRIIGSAIMKSKVNPERSAREVMGEVLGKCGLGWDEIGPCIGTGYGKEKIPFVDGVLSEIACHGKGARWLIPSVRTVIDIGGQDAKVMKLDEAGMVVKFQTNDKCASGTGRFLEVMAGVLGIDLEEMGNLSSKAHAPITFAATCTVWAQADAIKYLNSEYAIENIAAGINNAMARRVAVLVSTVGAERDVCLTGGVAKNRGVVKSLEKLVGQRIKRIRKADPQIAGAIGAALWAQEKVKGEARG